MRVPAPDFLCNVASENLNIFVISLIISGMVSGLILSWPSDFLVPSCSGGKTKHDFAA